MQRLAFWQEEVKRCFASYNRPGTSKQGSSKAQAEGRLTFPFNNLMQLVDKTLHTLVERSPFRVVSIDEQMVTIEASTGERKQIEVSSLKLAWDLLAVDGARLEFPRLELIEEKRASYMAPILATLPGIQASSWGDRPGWVQRDYGLAEKKPSIVAETWTPRSFVEWCLNNNPYLAERKRSDWDELSRGWTGPDNWPAFRKYLTGKIQEADPGRAKIARKMKRLGQAVEGLEDS
jgi:hypothetical protein